MIDPGQFKALVIRPTLEILSLGGAAAENLLLGTALTESGLVYLRQLGGPALGLYQCEPATHDDILAHLPAGYLQGHLFDLEPFPAADKLPGNLRYATAICRIHYRRVAEPLPAADDPAAMAAYHKRFYNTAAGATDPAVSIEHFRRAIAA